MKKRALLFLLTAALFTGKAMSQQPCSTDEMERLQLLAHPEIAVYKAELDRQIAEKIGHIDLKNAYKTTGVDQLGNPAFWYEIPIVVHFVHDYGDEYLTDDQIFNDLVQWNKTYAGIDGDTALVIAPFKKYAANTFIRLHLATRDPRGNATKGITRHRSYLSTNGNDQAKLDDWQPESYVNIWFIHNMSGVNAQAAAYAYQPPTAAALPFYDGVLALYSYNNNVPSSSKTINHEIGHVFNLEHPWGNTNNPDVACGDDGVDDTPPTKGHNPSSGCSPAALYDTVCANNYFKIYTNISGSDSLVDYPDTVNAENIMDYTYCARMFTKGQVVRMHIALNSDVANRKNLFDTTNLINTGVMDASYAFIPRPDLKPIPEFNSLVGGASLLGKMQYFTCPSTPLYLLNKSWNDTVTKVTWSASPSATFSAPTLTNPTYNYASNTKVTFTTPGWTSITMTATGNNTGDSTIVYNNAIFVADNTATPASTIVEEFDPAGSGAKWPTFNYYNNEFKWTQSNVGYYDNHSMEYLGYDSRMNPLLGIYPPTGSPLGDFDDMFSIPVDLSAYSSSSCNLNFLYSGASRSSASADINDSMLISYSIDEGKTWISLTTMKKNTLENKGALAIPYAPLYSGDWAAKTIPLPAPALAPYVVFRFRYFPNVGSNGYYSSGNNFYMDRVNFSQLPAEVSSIKSNDIDVVVAPNPTNNDAYVIVKDADNATASVTVSDIAGRTVYTASQQVSGKEARIEIPASVLTIKGIYMVQTRTGNQTNTQKLVVY